MGRNAIYLVIGFTFVFLMSSRNLSTVSTEAFKNAIQYYETAVGHNIAQAGANFACNQIFLQPNWRDGYTNVGFAGGASRLRRQMSPIPTRFKWSAPLPTTRNRT